MFKNLDRMLSNNNILIHTVELVVESVEIWSHTSIIYEIPPYSFDLMHVFSDQ